MAINIIQKVLRMGEGKKLKQLKERAAQVNALEDEISKLSDSDLKAKWPEFNKRFAEGESLNDLLTEVFAVVREIAKRTLDMRHFDVQIVGGIVLHESGIAEMATGEGKTLVATLAVCLNALAEKGVHLVTVNDYLAKRDTQWMGPIYHFLGLKVGVIQADNSFLYDPAHESPDPRLQNLRPVSKREAYQADVTYGTNNEFGFDYLRDNMATHKEEKVQRGHYFGIIDEVDSILIDEARTPLIISGPLAYERRQAYEAVERVVSRLKPRVVADSATRINGRFYRVSEDASESEMVPAEEIESQCDYVTIEKEHSALETDRGQKRIAESFGYDIKDLYGGEFAGEEIKEKLSLSEEIKRDTIRHIAKQAMIAHTLYKKDQNYVVKDGEVVIVDEFTGRLMEGRRYSDGLHEAIEAKEKVRVKEESQTLATITLQNYFRMYEKLAGMTGTAATEADEFAQIYKLETVVIEPNKPLRRTNLPDTIYKTEEVKFNTVVEDIVERHEKGQPLLVGTVSVEKSETLSRMLKRRGVPHEVLNAKYHEREADIVAQAGRKGSVTIATNMAGRGTDIVLGGNPSDPRDAKQVVAVGGLHMIGTERHEARRIDNQLRGRAGRQGDPGSSQFYLSLEDDLMRLFGSDRISKVMDRLSLPDEVPIENPLVSKSIETAQRQVESQNFNIRKHVLEYDDVMNTQRKVIYEERDRVLSGDDLYKKIDEFFTEVARQLVDTFANTNTHPEEWDWDGFFTTFKEIIPSAWGKDDIDIKAITLGELYDKVLSSFKDTYRQREDEIGKEKMRELERTIMLQVIDNRWREHLYEMDHMQEGIGLRAVAQKDPLVEFKGEAYRMFNQMIDGVKQDFVKYIFHVEIIEEPTEPQAIAAQGADLSDTAFSRAKAVSEAQAPREPRRVKKVGRNDPCPCGAVDPDTGKPIKYKKCCGKTS